MFNDNVFIIFEIPIVQLIINKISSALYKLTPTLFASVWKEVIGLTLNVKLMFYNRQIINKILVYHLKSKNLQ